MGASSREFMKLRMWRDDYDELPPETRDKIIIERIDVDGFDYSSYQEWIDLKSKEDPEEYKKYLKRKDLE